MNTFKINTSKEEKRELIRKALEQCTEPQQQGFNRMYGGIDLISEENMDRAYDQCIMTIKHNKKKVGL